MESHDLTKLIDSENKMTQTHHMNQIEIQARLKCPKTKTATKFTMEFYTKIAKKMLKHNLNKNYRLKYIEKNSNHIKNVKTERQDEHNMNKMEIRITQAKN